MTPDSVPVVAEQTSGLSPKAILAGLMPALGTVVAVLIMGAVTGEFDRLEVATALTGFSGALFAALGAYFGAPGTVVAQLPSEAWVGPPSDADKVAVRDQLSGEDGRAEAALLVGLLLLAVVAVIVYIVLAALTNTTVATVGALLVLVAYAASKL
jgi:hypothetical protein